MGIRAMVCRAKFNCSTVLPLGEICLYQYNPAEDLWDTRIGDGKTPVKDLPRLANHDIYERVAKLEQEISALKISIEHNG